MENMEENNGIEKRGTKMSVHSFGEIRLENCISFNGNRGIVEWGEYNKYPQFLLDLYNKNGSVEHKAIIDRKVRLTTGNGFVEITDTKISEFARKQKLDVEIEKCDIDLEIFNGFCIEIIKNNALEVISLKHVPIHKVRFGIKTDKLPDEHFWVSNDWNMYYTSRKKDLYKPQYIKRYTKETKEEPGRFLYYVTMYNPGDDGYYPIPYYTTGIPDIMTDFNTSEFHLNEQIGGYFPNVVFTFKRPQSDSEKSNFLRQFSNEFKGTSSRGKLIILEAPHPDDIPEFKTIEPTTTDSKFLPGSQRTSEKIIRAHGIPAQLLLLYAGQLGSTEDRAELMKEFQQSYISKRQIVLEDALNDILNTEQFKFKTYIQDDVNGAVAVEGEVVNGELPKPVDPNDINFQKMNQKDINKIFNIANKYNAGKITYQQAIIVLGKFGISEEQADKFIHSYDDNIEDEI